MAGGDQSRARKQRSVREEPVAEVRVTPGASRVSRAAGIVGSEQIRVEQHSGASANKRSTSTTSNGRKRTGGSGASASDTRGSGAYSQGSRRKADSRAPESGSRSSAGGRNFLVTIWDAWQNVEPRRQQQVYNLLLLVFALIIFLSLTILQKSPVFSGLHDFFSNFLGWGAYILDIGLIVLSITRLVETVKQQKYVRWSFVLGMTAMWLIILTESQLLISGKTGGIVGGLLATPLLGWPAAVGHILLFGLFCIATILTFRLTLAHFRIAWHFLWNFLAGGDERRRKSTFEPEEDVYEDEDLEEPEEYTGTGQRPRYSRYISASSPEAITHNALNDPDATLFVDHADLGDAFANAKEQDLYADDEPEPVEYRYPNRTGGYRQQQYQEEEIDYPPYQEEDEGDLYKDRTVQLQEGEEYEDEVEDDPLNDINIHKSKVGLVPRGNRHTPSMDRNDFKAMTRGARQQNLPAQEETKSEPTAINLMANLNKNRGNTGTIASPSSSTIRNQVQQYQTQEQPFTPPEPEPIFESGPISPSRARSRGKQVPKPVSSAPVQPALLPNIISSWQHLPDLDLLNSPAEIKAQIISDDTDGLAKIIQDTLRSFRVDAEVRTEDISVGPTVIRFGIRPTGKPLLRVDESGKQVPARDASGQIIYETRTRVSRIMALQNDLALVMEAKSIRMEAPVPGRPYVGVEIPNKNSRLVTLREVLETKEFQAASKKSKLAVALGQDVAGAVKIGDLARMPHLLIAGATGAGKSVCVNAIIASILTNATPDDVRFLMVDPKMVELSMYNGIPHLLSPVVTEVDKVVGVLKNAINEMERRYRLFSQLGVRNLEGYRRLRRERSGQGDLSLNNLPSIVLIIDELADLMMAAPEEVESMICRLAQLARATGIHLVVATQRPSVDVITGLIKANIPTRISFMVSSAVDSRTIIDMGGAERLLGRGDMLYLPADVGKPERIQGAFVADDEAETLVTFWREEAAQKIAEVNNGQEPDLEALQGAVEPGWEVKGGSGDDFALEDELLEEAERVVREYERASISLLQRRLRIGYSRAARLIDLLEERGIIGRAEPGGRSREVLDDSDDYHGFNNAHTMVDEVDDIVAEEKQRQDALKKAESRRLPPNYMPSRGADNDDDIEELDL